MDFGEQLHLFQLADASLPTGGYAFSNGLEASARLGLIRSSDELEQYLTDFARQVCTSEIPFVNDCYRLDGGAIGPATVELVRQLDAFLTIPSIHKASVVQGRNWLAAAQAVFGVEAIGDLEPLHREHGLPCHYTTCFGLSLRLTGTGVESARNLYLYLGLRDQISVAVRLGLIGPQYGMKQLARMLGRGEEMLEAAAALGAGDAHRCGPLLEIAQAWHPNIYSKLFQN